MPIKGKIDIELTSISIYDYDVLCVPISLSEPIDMTPTQCFVKRVWKRDYKMINDIHDQDTMHLGDCYISDHKNIKAAFIAVQSFTPRQNKWVKRIGKHFHNPSKFIDYGSICTSLAVMSDKLYKLDYIPIPDDYVNPRVLMPLFGDDSYYGGSSEVVEALIDENTNALDVYLYDEKLVGLRK